MPYPTIVDITDIRVPSVSECPFKMGDLVRVVQPSYVSGPVDTASAIQTYLQQEAIICEIVKDPHKTPHGVRVQISFPKVGYNNQIHSDLLINPCILETVYDKC